MYSRICSLCECEQLNDASSGAIFFSLSLSLFLSLSKVDRRESFCVGKHGQFVAVLSPSISLPDAPRPRGHDGSGRVSQIGFPAEAASFE